MQGGRIYRCLADGLNGILPFGGRADHEPILLTPICAHTLNIRPLVIREEDVVHIHLLDTRQSIIVTIDGQETTPIRPDDTVTVRCSDVRAGIIKFEDKDYYQTLRTKLWRNC